MNDKIWILFNFIWMAVTVWTAITTYNNAVDIDNLKMMIDHTLRSLWEYAQADDDGACNNCYYAQSEDISPAEKEEACRECKRGSKDE